VISTGIFFIMGSLNFESKIIYSADNGEVFEGFLKRKDIAYVFVDIVGETEAF